MKKIKEEKILRDKEGRAAILQFVDKEQGPIYCIERLPTRYTLDAIHQKGFGSTDPDDMRYQGT